MTEILLFGLGAVGATHAYILQHAGAKVTVVARSNYQIVKDQGLDFRSEKYGDHNHLTFARVVKTPSDPSLKGIKFDFVVMTNKAISPSSTSSSASVEEQIAPCVSDETTIVIIQNGVGNADPFRARFPNNVILSAVTWVSANQIENGVVVHKMREKMQIGVEWSPEQKGGGGLSKQVQEAKLDEFVGLLEKGESEYEVVPNIQQWRWKKTIWNCCWNSLTAMSLCNTKMFLESSEAASTTAKSIINEMASIARALGLEIEDSYLDHLFTNEVLRKPPNGIESSMMQDAKHHRPMEVEVILNSPLRIAKRLGLKTPVLETCSAILTAMDCRFKQEQSQK